MVFLSSTTAVSYPDRLSTFKGYWDEHEATARQLAAIGHVYDRPPLESLVDGSRCLRCEIFVRSEDSIKALEGSVGETRVENGLPVNFHYPLCERLQVKIPLEPRAAISDFYSGRKISEMRKRFDEHKPGCRDATHGTGTDGAATDIMQRSGFANSEQPTSLFSLPVEIRLQIYSLILPSLPSVTTIVPLHGDSARVATLAGARKAGPRDLTRTNILATCKIVHHEALDFLFDNRIYYFPSSPICEEKKLSSSKTLYLFLRHIGHRGRSMLRSVDIHIGGREDAVAFSLLGSCPRLKKITIRHGRHNIMFPHAPIWYVDGIASLLELSGLERVDFGDAGTPHSLCESDPDAILVKSELLRPKGVRSSVKWIEGRWLDL